MNWQIRIGRLISFSVECLRVSNFLYVRDCAFSVHAIEVRNIDPSATHHTV
jgi:hypothetical protein